MKLQISPSFQFFATLAGVMSDEVDEVGRRIIEEEKFFTKSVNEYPAFYRFIIWKYKV